MAMMTGRVQIQETTKPREIEVGHAFARNDDGQWKSLDGEKLNHAELKASAIKSRIQKKKKAQK